MFRSGGFRCAHEVWVRYIFVCIYSYENVAYWEDRNVCCHSLVQYIHAYIYFLLIRAN